MGKPKLIPCFSIEPGRLNIIVAGLVATRTNDKLFAAVIAGIEPDAHFVKNRGGVLELELGPKPNKNWGVGEMPPIND